MSVAGRVGGRAADLAVDAVARAAISALSAEERSAADPQLDAIAARGELARATTMVRWAPLLGIVGAVASVVAIAASRHPRSTKI